MSESLPDPMPEPMNEADLLDHIAARSSNLHGYIGGFGRVVIGPGDDAAVVETAGGQRWAYTVDQLVGGRHFDPDLLMSVEGIDLVARKAVARSVSDLAAMGARPAWGLATGLLPDGSTRADQLFDALARWARHWSCPLIGGDIASTHAAASLAISVTCAGTFEDGASVLTRSGAKPGDEVFVTGALGGSLASGHHLTFEPRIDTGLAAAREPGVHAAIDLSDGLGLDADRVARASGVHILIDTAAIPMHPGVHDWRAAASGGEDYELFLCIDPSQSQRIASQLGLIGPLGTVHATSTHHPAGAWLRESNGTDHAGSTLGYIHGRE